MTKATTIAATLVALAATAAGCAGPGASSQTAAIPPPPATPRAVSSATGIHLPFDDYGLTSAENALLGAAHSALVRACAARFGVRVTMPAPKNASVDQLNARRYGLVDAGTVGDHGYAPGAALADGDVHGTDDKAESSWDPSPAEEFVLRGPQGSRDPLAGSIRDTHGSEVPAGGCVGEADRRLGGRPPFDPGRLSGETFAASERDPRVVAATRVWASCMAERGYDYRSPWEPNDRQWPAPTSAEEIATARADLACRERSALVPTWYGVETALQQQVIDQHREQFAQLRSWKAARLGAATRATSGAAATG
jgi:hypothetical protein